MTTVKTRYVRDPIFNDRVMTLVSRIEEDGSVSYAFTINNPTQWVTTGQTRDYIVAEKRKGDMFCKKKGREIAFARLEHERTRWNVTLTEGERPLEAILKHIISDVEVPAAKRIARMHLEDLAYLERYQQAVEAERVRRAEAAV